MKYEVRVNNNYMNSFKTYSEAVELRDNLLAKGFKNVVIISL